MKRTTVYWLLLLGVLIGISGIYTKSKNFDQPQLTKRASNLFRTIQIGDLYVFKDEAQKVTKFFKIAGNPKADSVFILVGNPHYSGNFTSSGWIKKIIDRPIYFESTLQKVAQSYLWSISYKKEFKCTIYRRHYPAENYPFIMHLMYLIHSSVY